MDGRCRGEHLLKPLCTGKWSVRHVKYFVPPENVFIMKPLWDFCPFCMENFLANMSRGSYPIGDASFLITYIDYIQEIDGHSLLLLTAWEIHHILGIQLGPAMKIHDYVFSLQQLVNDAYLKSKTKVLLQSKPPNTT